MSVYLSVHIGLPPAHVHSEWGFEIHGRMYSGRVRGTDPGGTKVLTENQGSWELCGQMEGCQGKWTQSCNSRNTQEL